MGSDTDLADEFTLTRECRLLVRPRVPVLLAAWRNYSRLASCLLVLSEMHDS